MKMKEPEKKPRRRVRKVTGHGGHHGGAWKVAYADFVTAMMALFLVLWLVSQADTKVKQAIANYFRAPGVFDSMQGGVVGGPKKVSKEPSPMTSKDEEQALYTTAEILKKKFETRPEFGRYKDQIKIDVTDEGLKIQILDQAERVSFGSGSAELTPETAAILKEIANGICQMPNPILIGGHTDRHIFPEGSTYTNWELSADRANAARRVLESNCVKPELIRRIVGYADTELLVPDDPYAAANRRISITVLRLHKEGANEQDGAKADDGTKPDAKAVVEPVIGEVAPPSNRVKAESNLKGESVSVGEPDKLPANVSHTRQSVARK
jgi:chemotaxis protein MotB